ncbi:MAG: hypothetical protein HN802_05345 [Candidatus Jacksonbacteria bacterium]|nr:hypothetical protein [Candidatus Jacksonbacteria bacterium]
MNGGTLNKVRKYFYDITHYLNYFTNWLYDTNVLYEDEYGDAQDKPHPNPHIEWFRIRAEELNRIPQKEFPVFNYLTPKFRFNAKFKELSNHLMGAFMYLTHDGLSRFKPGIKARRISISTHNHDAREAIASFYSLSFNIARELQGAMSRGEILAEPSVKEFKQRTGMAAKVFNSYIGYQASILNKKVKVIRSSQIIKTHGMQFFNQLVRPSALRPIDYVLSVEGSVNVIASQKYERFSDVEAILDFDANLYVLIVEQQDLGGFANQNPEHQATMIPTIQIIAKISDPELFEVTMSGNGPGRHGGAHGEHGTGEHLLQNMPLDASMTLWYYNLTDIYRLSEHYIPYRKIIAAKGKSIDKFNKLTDLLYKSDTYIQGYMKAYYYGEEIGRVHPYISPNTSGRCTGGFNEIDAASGKLNLVSGLVFVKQWLSKYIQGHTNPQNNIDHFIVGIPPWLTDRYTEVNGRIGDWEKCKQRFFGDRVQNLNYSWNTLPYPALSTLETSRIDQYNKRQVVGCDVEETYKNLDNTFYKSSIDYTARLEAYHCTDCALAESCPKFSQFRLSDSNPAWRRMQARRAVRNKTALEHFLDDALIETIRTYINEYVLPQRTITDNDFRMQLERFRILLDNSWPHLSLNGAHTPHITTVQFLTILYDAVLPEEHKHFAKTFASVTETFRHEYRLSGLRQRMGERITYYNEKSDDGKKEYREKAAKRLARFSQSFEQANKIHWKFGVGYWLGTIPPLVTNEALWEDQQQAMKELNVVSIEEPVDTFQSASERMIDAVLNNPPVFNVQATDTTSVRGAISFDNEF